MNRKIIMIIVVVFAVGLFAGCKKQEKMEGKKVEQPAQSAVQEAEKTQKKVQAPAELSQEKAAETKKKEPEAKPIQEKPVPAAPGKEITVAGAQYVGAKKCKACHFKEYKSWEITTMATSFENLKPGARAEAKKKAGLNPDKDYTHDAGCLKCHTTGYGRSGGFKSIEETQELAGVQCEGCHGPGGKYLEIMKKNKEFKLSEVKAVGLVIPSEDEKGCMKCHGDESPFNAKVDPKYMFDFKERLKKTHEHFPLKYKH